MCGAAQPPSRSEVSVNSSANPVARRYNWRDRLRSARSTNDARQAVFSQLDGELQRKVGLKVLEMGGNAVLGYRQEFDLEGDAMVARGIGSAVVLAGGASR